ncbi:MAG: hypothetical protein LQ344_006855 [Seirophora lacunosa]|nr:MAG: hypothetical protein LQ344_006855 [Seirophora lacunosa]
MTTTKDHGARPSGDHERLINSSIILKCTRSRANGRVHRHAGTQRRESVDPVTTSLILPAILLLMRIRRTTDSVIPDVNGSLPHAEKKTIEAVRGPTETVIYERIHEAYARRRNMALHRRPFLALWLIMPSPRHLNKARVPHVFTGRAWQLIAGAISQGDRHLPPTAEQRAEASKLYKEISVSLKHTSPEVNATASLAAHLGGYTDLVASNQRLVAQTKVLLHRGESQQRELKAAQSEVARLHGFGGSGFPTPAKPFTSHTKTRR